LALSTDQLRSTRDALSTANSTIAQQDGQIANLTAIRKRLLHQLGITRKQLAEAKGSLSHARSQISLQAGQINIAKTCLGGVNLALNDLWNYDYNGMASALGAVQGACNQSYAMF
jgi:septal ring factor EnvC (AmiA/AmiB activator)